MTFNLNLTDGQVHEVSLYAVDWDNKGRSEEIQIIDPTTGKVLDTESIGHFQGGAYLSWNLSGNVVIKVTSLGGPNAVINGLFFGGKPATALTSQRQLPGYGCDDGRRLARDLRFRRLRHRRGHQRRQPQAAVVRHPGDHRRLDLHLDQQHHRPPACRTRPTPVGSPPPGTPAPR